VHKKNKIPEVAGRTVSEAMKILKEKYNATLLGIVRNGNVILNPKNYEKIEKDDEIIYVAEAEIR